MQVCTEIRRKVLAEKVPKRQIRRDYKIGFHTLAKMLGNVEPPGYQQRRGGPTSGRRVSRAIVDLSGRLSNLSELLVKLIHWMAPTSTSLVKTDN